MFVCVCVLFVCIHTHREKNKLKVTFNAVAALSYSGVNC